MGARTRRTAPLVAVSLIAPAVLVMIMTSASAMAADTMPEGVPVATSAVIVALRILMAAWGLLLLLAGRLRPRWVVATVAAAFTLGVGAGLLGDRSYLAALAVAWLLLLGAMAVDIRAPRVGLAIASWWPLAAAFAVHGYLHDMFRTSRPLLLILVVVNIALAALLPRLGAVILSVACGTVALVIALPLALNELLVLGLVAAGLVVQLLVVPRLRGPEQATPVPDPQPEAGSAEDTPPTPPTPSRVAAWRRAALASLAAFVGVAVLTAALAPRIEAGSPEQEARLEALFNDPAAASIGFVATPESTTYLGGTGYPMALVSRKPGALDRIKVLLTGASLDRIVRRLRGVKSETELAAMHHAARITSETFGVIEPMIRPGVSEATIHQAIESSFRERGASRIAFGCIVGSGANAAIPHYDHNDQIMDRGLVVIDIGCMADGYASDMTRTFVVSGTPTDAEQELLEITARAAEAARAVLGPGVSMHDVDQAARTVIEDAGFGDFFIHSVGHHVGLQVHDPHQPELEPGMVVTIEPGIYITQGADVDPAYWDLGVRLEDTYVVTDTGWEMLTHYPLLPASIRAPAE